jgi:hypothetical protein
VAEPLEKPGIVAVARSPPVGRPAEVARIDTVRFGVVPVQPEQKSWRSTLVSCPVIAGMKVWPPQLAVPKLVPVDVPPVDAWSTFGAFSSETSPGLPVRSQFVATPAWKSACVVSVRHPLLGEVCREKFRVVAPFAAMPMLWVEAET